MENAEIIKTDTFSVIIGKVNNSEIGIMRFYVFRNNHDNTYTSVKGYHRGSTYSSFWVPDYKFVPQTYTVDDLLDGFRDCEFMGEASPY